MSAQRGTGDIVHELVSVIARLADIADRVDLAPQEAEEASVGHSDEGQMAFRVGFLHSRALMAASDIRTEVSTLRFIHHYLEAL